MKIKRILTCVILVLFFISSVGILSGCNNKNNPDSNHPSGESSTPTPETSITHIDKTYTGTKPSNSGSLGSQSSQESKYEADVVSIKLKEDGNVFLVYELWIYEGTYTQTKTETGYDINVTLVEGEDIYKVCLTISGENLETATIKDSNDTENELLGTTTITLTATEDVLFDNGLYVGLGSYTASNNTYNTQIEAGAYYLKLSNNEIYAYDSVDSASKITIEKLGSNLVYKINYDRAGEDGETNLFFVEKKGEHSEGFVNAFGDLDYVIYACELEGGGNLNKYYHTKSSEETTTLKITESITFNASKLFKSNYVDSTYTYENVNMQLTLNTNGSVTFIVTGNEKYNVVCSGKWYVIGKTCAQGVFIKLTDSKFFNGYFALGVSVDEGNVQLSDFKSEASSSIDATDSITYDIGWGTTAQAQIENGESWVEEA